MGPGLCSQATTWQSQASAALSPTGAYDQPLRRGTRVFQIVVLAALIVTNAVLLFLLFRPVL